MFVMDPQSVSFTPRDELWRFQTDMLRVQQTQAEHAERLARLERRQEDDARMKSVWGGSSGFPGVLGGTPQQVPLHQPTPDIFSSFDDQSNHLISSLHLDADDEPKRLGAASRANSVRFDETANQGHWAHASRSSMDLIPRSTSSLGGHPMTERSYSHKSDGRQSSAAASVHSATSGRANSMGADSIFAVGTPASDIPRLAPGLFILGSVPAIIRCWLNTNFKHDSLLYAAICTGSYTSCLDLALISKLGFEPHITRDEEGIRKIKLELYLPEAVPHPASSRSSSPAPQLPSLTVDFTVVESVVNDDSSKPIQIFLGSDMLRAHNADILFSSNTLSLYDDDRSKLSVPLVRPEDERTFKYLQVISAPLADATKLATPTPAEQSADVRTQPISAGNLVPESIEVAPGFRGAAAAPSVNDSDRNVTASSDDGTASNNDRGRTLLGTGSRAEQRGSSEVESSAPSISRTPSSPVAWSSWRHDTEKSEKLDTTDWASLGRNTHSSSNSTSFPRREGIKVLRPIRTGSRAVSTGASQPASASPLTGGQSRFFDEGRRRVTSVSASGKEVTDPQLKRSTSSDAAKAPPGGKENTGTPAANKPRSANPVGGASAFAWLNSTG